MFKVNNKNTRTTSMTSMTPEVVQLKCDITIVIELKFGLPKSSQLNGVLCML